MLAKQTIKITFCMRRNWQDRRVACTKDVIAFARADESTLLDAIPLFEVMSIEVMISVDQRADQHGQQTNSYDAVVDFTNAFQIRTVKNGQNAGRKYVLRANSAEEVTAIMDQLSDLAKKAAENEAAKTWRDKLQQRVRQVYISQWFQAITTTLIIAV